MPGNLQARYRDTDSFFAVYTRHRRVHDAPQMVYVLAAHQPCADTVSNVSDKEPHSQEGLSAEEREVC